jgi:hypothetical protein
MTIEDLLKSLRENPGYQKALEKMSDEERKIAEKASEDLLRDFQEKCLNPIWDNLRNNPKK